MEFAVALFGALASNALPKLFALGTNQNKTLAKNASNIHSSLAMMRAALQDIQTSSIGGYDSALQKVGIKELCHLVADIEDCIDSFEAGKMNRKDFSEKIKELEDTRQGKNAEIAAFVSLVNSLKGSPPGSSSGPAGQRLSAAGLKIQAFMGNNNGSINCSYLNCLQYFCMLPCDRPVQRNPLIRRLLAEGLVVAESGHPTLQDAAAHYLDKLITDQIILTIKESSNGKVKRCKTPEDILEYMSDDSMSEHFMRLCDHREPRPGYARRLSVRPGSAGAAPRMELPPELGNIRTLAVFPAENPISYESFLDFTKYKVLRLLDLKECANVSRKDDIWNLLMLKYLSLGVGIIEVPRSVENLKMLVTLDLDRNIEVTVFSEILELPNLKHLLGKLRLLTYDIWLLRKKNLKNFLENESKLETLSGFVTGKKQGFAMLLSHMNSLRKVKIWCNSPANKGNWKIIKKGIEKFISKVGCERSLCIDFIECYGERVESIEFRPTASTGHTAPASSTVHKASASSTGVGYLSSLKLRGKLQSIPKFVKSMAGIKEVCLSWTTLTGEKIILVLSDLKQLVYLKLEEDSLKLDIKNSHFQALKRICIVCDSSLNIEIQSGALESLVLLHLICKTLVVPMCVVDIEPMSELKKIVLDSAYTALRGDLENAARNHGKKTEVSFAPDA